MRAMNAAHFHLPPISKKIADALSISDIREIID